MFLCSRGHCPLSDSRRTAGSSVVRAKRVEALYKSHNTASLPCRGSSSYSCPVDVKRSVRVVQSAKHYRPPAQQASCRERYAQLALRALL